LYSIMDDTKQQLMDAAGPLFAEKGFRATTVREIADAARANQAAINYHFRDKENLYVECVRHSGQACMARVPMPVWPDGTPPQQKLRDFIRMFLDRVVVDHDPPWHGLLIMRELFMPTRACSEFVKEYVRPNFAALAEILKELLPADVAEQTRVMIGFSIVGQILHYRSARPVLEMLVGTERFRAFDVDTLTRHITEFSLAAIAHYHPSDSSAEAS
jgi:TetR/AcrR family transcriptional regulator, regulator of cefoperazone and chloramphenicol sensitivity